MHIAARSPVFSLAESRVDDKEAAGHVTEAASSIDNWSVRRASYRLGY